MLNKVRIDKWRLHSLTSGDVIFFGIGIFALLIFLLPSSIQQHLGNLYQQSIFLLFRVVYDHLLGWLPFPSFYWLLALWVWFLFHPLLHRDISLIFRLVKFAARLFAILGFFYLLWGFNYLAESPQERLGLERKRIPVEQLEKAYCRELESMRLNRPDSFSFKKTELEEDVRKNVSSVLEATGIRTSGNPRVRVLKPHGVLLRLATAGVYMPFTGEGQIDGGMHPIIQGFTMAHEMAHAYGIGHEGSCNFIAYLAGLRSSDPLLNYSTHISYWRYLASEIRKLSSEDYKRLWLEVDPLIREDLNRIDEYYDRYPDLIPLARSPIYDQYLKMQGMNEGLGTYLQIITWVESWYNKNVDDNLRGNE